MQTYRLLKQLVNVVTTRLYGVEYEDCKRRLPVGRGTWRRLLIAKVQKVHESLSSNCRFIGYVSDSRCSVIWLDWCFAWFSQSVQQNNMKQVMTTTFHILTFLPCILISPSYSKTYILYSWNSVFKQREPQSVIFATSVASPVRPPVLLQIPLPLFLKFKPSQLIANITRVNLKLTWLSTFN